MCESSFMMELIFKECHKANQIQHHRFLPHLCVFFFFLLFLLRRTHASCLASASLTETLVVLCKHCNDITTILWQFDTLEPPCGFLNMPASDRQHICSCGHYPYSNTWLLNLYEWNLKQSFLFPDRRHRPVSTAVITHRSMIERKMSSS